MLSAKERANAVARLAAWAKIGNLRLASDSPAQELPFDLLEKIGENGAARAESRARGCAENWIADAADTFDPASFGCINDLCNRMHRNHQLQIAVVLTDVVENVEAGDSVGSDVQLRRLR